MGRAKLHQSRLPEVDWSVQDGEKDELEEEEEEEEEVEEEEEEEGDSTQHSCLDEISQNVSVKMQESAAVFP